MPKRSRSGLVNSPARVVAPTSVNFASSILTERAAGPSPMMRSSWKSSIAGYSTSSDLIGQQPRAGGGADQRELCQLDLDRARRRSLADDEVELEILHRRIQHFLRSDWSTAPRGWWRRPA